MSNLDLLTYNRTDRQITHFTCGVGDINKCVNVVDYLIYKLPSCTIITTLVTFKICQVLHAVLTTILILSIKSIFAFLILLFALRLTPDILGKFITMLN